MEEKKSFPNKSTQFSKENQPEKNGRPKGVLNSKTILERFLSITKNMTNPLNNEVEDLTMAELITLKQIANALNGDLAAYKEITDRFEGRVMNKQEIDHTTGGEKLPTNTTNLAITLPNGKTIDDFKVD